MMDNDEKWFTEPSESESGNLIFVTGRNNMEDIIAKGKYNERVEVTWTYESETGMPDETTGELMETVQEALIKRIEKERTAYLTGIYTGDGQRNWVFYTLNVKAFGYKLNEALSAFDLLPITLYVEKDPEWNEYREMLEIKG